MIEIFKLMAEFPGCRISLEHEKVGYGWRAVIEKILPSPIPENRKRKQTFRIIVPFNEERLEAIKDKESYILSQLRGAFEEVFAAQPSTD